MEAVGRVGWWLGMHAGSTGKVAFQGFKVDGAGFRVVGLGFRVFDLRFEV